MTLDIDTLAQEIRRVDGNHSLGAGALAEALMPFLRSYIESRTGEVVGIAGEMPGSNGGFTMAAFEADKIPVGTKIYASPVQPVKLEWKDFWLGLNGRHIGGIQAGGGATYFHAILMGERIGGRFDSEADARADLESAARKWLSGGGK